MDESTFHNKCKSLYLDYLDPLQNKILEKRPNASESLRQRENGEYQRDYARIMYSSSFRRLQGKMQMLGIRSDRFFRNRLTHSLEVAQIARSIAQDLGYSIDAQYVVEAGALAHDLGNPPFGHAGERALCDIYKDVGGFEGNAQTLRVLMHTERKKQDFFGLNLTWRTLLSVAKYFTRREEKDGIHAKFIYNDDYMTLHTFVNENQIRVRTLDVQIVDIADEIAYAAHDLEDGLRTRAFTIEEIQHDFERAYGSGDLACQCLNRLVDNARKVAGFGNGDVDADLYLKLFRQELASSIIHELISDITLLNISDTVRRATHTTYDKELGFARYANLADGLKQIVFQCLCYGNDTFSYEKEGENVLRTLSLVFQENPRYLPPEYRATDEMRKQDANIDRRLACDYLAGMMDSYAIATYEKFSGKAFRGGH